MSYLPDTAARGDLCMVCLRSHFFAPKMIAFFVLIVSACAAAAAASFSLRRIGEIKNSS